VENINLEDISKGRWSLSPEYAKFILQGCVVTLHRNNHKGFVLMNTVGIKPSIFSLIWPQDCITEQIERSWLDQNKATEQAAECLAFLIIPKITNMDLFRAFGFPNGGFDFWLGHETSTGFERKARLEVSGIFKGNDRIINQRFQKKSRQTDKSDNLRMDAYIFISEFSRPITKIDFKDDL
jgi:hypothetical protein